MHITSHKYKIDGNIESNLKPQFYHGIAEAECALEYVCSEYVPRYIENNWV